MVSSRPNVQSKSSITRLSAIFTFCTKAFSIRFWEQNLLVPSGQKIFREFCQVASFQSISRAGTCAVTCNDRALCIDPQIPVLGTKMKF
eukprot:Skav207341  [mRNA]  locus=scaffold426:73987:74253:- [translate_table: standard]